MKKKTKKKRENEKKKKQKNVKFFFQLFTFLQEHPDQDDFKKSISNINTRLLWYPAAFLLLWIFPTINRIYLRSNPFFHFSCFIFFFSITIFSVAFFFFLDYYGTLLLFYYYRYFQQSISFPFLFLLFVTAFFFVFSSCCFHFLFSSQFFVYFALLFISRFALAFFFLLIDIRATENESFALFVLHVLTDPVVCQYIKQQTEIAKKGKRKKTRIKNRK